VTLIDSEIRGSDPGLAGTQARTYDADKSNARTCWEKGSRGRCGLTNNRKGASKDEPSRLQIQGRGVVRDIAQSETLHLVSVFSSVTNRQDTRALYPLSPQRKCGEQIMRSL
jgi:hypothetical protein